MMQAEVVRAAAIVRLLDFADNEPAFGPVRSFGW
jgi:hypothetical protein